MHYKSGDSVGNSLPRSGVRTSRSRTRRGDGMCDFRHVIGSLDGRCDVSLRLLLESLKGQIPKVEAGGLRGRWSLIMVECVVCRYWSERLEEARRRRRGNGPLNEENRVIGALRKHQCGACACKYPHLLKHLVKGEPWLPFKTPNFCDPVRIRIIAPSLHD